MVGRGLVDIEVYLVEELLDIAVNPDHITEIPICVFPFRRLVCVAAVQNVTSTWFVGRTSL